MFLIPLQLARWTEDQQDKEVTYTWSVFVCWSVCHTVLSVGLVPHPVPSSEAAAIGDNEGTTGRFREVLPAGVLLVEPYCWKDIVLKPPALSMSTTAVQTALLSLPPGSVVWQCQSLRVW